MASGKTKLVLLFDRIRHASPTAPLSQCLVKSASEVRGKMCAAFSEMSQLFFLRRVAETPICKRQHTGRHQGSSGAAGLHVAVDISCVNGALGLESGLILAWGPALTAVSDTIGEIDGETCWRIKRKLEKVRAVLKVGWGSLTYQ